MPDDFLFEGTLDLSLNSISFQQDHAAQASFSAQMAIQREEDANIFRSLMAASPRQQVPLEYINNVVDELGRTQNVFDDLVAMGYTDLEATQRVIQSGDAFGGVPVGAFPIRQDITVLPEGDPARLRIGWRVYEEVGIAVINDYAISRVDVGGYGEAEPWISVGDGDYPLAGVVTIGELGGFYHRHTLGVGRRRFDLG